MDKSSKVTLKKDNAYYVIRKKAPQSIAKSKS